MAFIGATPTPIPLTATDIPDLPATKITSGTFPALNGSNLTNLDASDLTGTLPAISGANLTGVSAGKILQVTASGYIADFSTTNTSFVDATGFTVAITPSATSSKVLLMCNFNCHVSDSGAYFQARWERQISGGSDTEFGHGTYGQTYARSAVANDFFGGVSMTYLDSPSTTSAITYQLRWSTSSGTAYLGNNSTNQNRAYAFEIEG
jgi:hypothetical protein|tara:strand:+ start:49 stop:669 length:621 start_codon:yes stop_codon:yes gene_type:complete